MATEKIESKNYFLFSQKYLVKIISSLKDSLNQKVKYSDGSVYFGHIKNGEKNGYGK